MATISKRKSITPLHSKEISRKHRRNTRLNHTSPANPACARLRVEYRQSHSSSLSSHLRLAPAPRHCREKQLPDGHSANEQHAVSILCPTTSTSCSAHQAQEQPSSGKRSQTAGSIAC